MRCLVDYARTKSGLGTAAQSASLDTSAQAKAEDILRCQDFSHTACGRAWDYWFKAPGNFRASSWSENIAWGSDSGGRSTPRSIMNGWLNSDGHRRNILSTSFNAKGVGLAQGTFNGYRAGVWVQHFARQ